MRTARVGFVVLALALALGCSSSENEPQAAAGASGSSGSGGSLANTVGAVGQPSAGTGAAAASGGAGSGGLAAGGNTAAGNGHGGGSAGTSGGGGSAGVSAGGRANGGAAGANGGSGGTGTCTKNLACKLSPPPATDDLYQDCVDRINQFLTQCACLPPLARRKDGEACADQMAEYDAGQNTAHAGFTDKICQPSGSQNECPGYSSNAQVIGLCMQQMWDEGPPPTSTCTGSCYEDHGHFINMTDASVTKVACGFYTTAGGKVWAVQNFSR